MNTFADTLTFYDLQRIPLDIIKDIVTDCGYEPKDYQKNAMSQLIWDEISQTPSRRKELFGDHELSVFSSKCSLSWFKLASLTNLKEKIIEKLGVEIITGQLNIREEDINSIPKLFSISDCPESLGVNCFIARYLYQDGFYYIPTTNGNDRIKKVKTLTALIDENNGIIEVRARSPLNKKIVQNLLSYFEDSPQITEFKILANHRNDTQNLAESLDGYLIESIGEPTLPLEDLNIEQVEALISLLSVIDEGLSEEDSSPNYELSITNAREALFTTQDPVPFLALILAGLNKVSLSTLYESLISSPLYNSLSPYLTNRGGYVKFSSPFNGIVSDYTIQVAQVANSIYLTGNSNELAIKKIRDTLFILQEAPEAVEEFEVQDLVLEQ